MIDISSVAKSYISRLRQYNITPPDESDVRSKLQELLESMYYDDAYMEFSKLPIIDQLQTFYNYLDRVYSIQEFLDPVSIAIGLVAFAAGMLTMHFGREYFKRTVERLIVAIARTGDKVGEVLREKYKHDAIRYQVIYRNEEKCYSRCGVEPSEKLVSVLRSPSTAKVQKYEQAMCLVDCFVTHTIDKIAINYAAYLRCAIAAGVLSPEEIRRQLYSEQILSAPVGEKCYDLQKLLKQYLTQFNDLLDALFPSTGTRDQRMYRIKYERMLNEALRLAASRVLRETRS